MINIFKPKPVKFGELSNLFNQSLVPYAKEMTEGERLLQSVKGDISSQRSELTNVFNREMEREAQSGEDFSFGNESPLDLGETNVIQAPKASPDVPSVNVTGDAHKRRADVKYNGVPASVRYNNPAAAYPRASDNKYGLEGYGVLDGGKQGTHKIGKFPTPVHGGAANFDLFASKYKGMTLYNAVAKWRGNKARGEKVVVPKGYDPNQRVTSAFLNDPDRAVDFFRKMAQHETGSKQALSNEQWGEAWKMWKAGGAKNYERLKRG